MTAVTAAIVASVVGGIAAERRWGTRAQAWSARAMTALLWVVFPFVTFFTIARLEITTGVGAGLGLAYVELAVVGLLAYGLGTRVLGLNRPQVGALMCVTVLANTGFLGAPLIGALLGSDALAPAIAFDTIVSGPMLYVVGFAIGAAFGAEPGASRGARVRAFITRNPPLIALVAALIAPDALAPDALVDVAQVLLYAVLPVGFVVLGVNLAAEADDGALAFPPPLSAPVATGLALRLLAAPALFLALTAAIVDVPDAYLVQAAMPSGINSLVIAHAYGLDLRLTASTLAWSTAIVIAAAVVLSAVPA